MFKEITFLIKDFLFQSIQSPGNSTTEKYDAVVTKTENRYFNIQACKYCIILGSYRMT